MSESANDRLFLTAEEVAELTDCKTKTRQIEWLRSNRVPFFVSALGRPKVTRAAIEGRKEQEVKQGWTSRAFG